MQTRLDLTFGIELECVMSFDPANYRGALRWGGGPLWKKEISAHLHEESKMRFLLRNHITRLLTDNGFPAYNVVSEGGNQKWTVTNDTSIEIQDGPRGVGGFLECDIEIKSPAMRFCPKALRRVEKVIDLIKRNFDTSINESCGFHVHIGNRKKAFPLQTLKHLCMLTAMFEHQLNSLHPAHRVGNLHAKGPSAVFRGQNPWDTLMKIQGCKTKVELVLLYANNEGRLDRCFAYNLGPVVTSPNKTIEFRQHESTLDLEKIVNWVKVAARMVVAMHETSTEDLAKLISSCAFDPRYPVTDLLSWLKLNHLIRFYCFDLHQHQRPEPLWIRDTRVKAPCGKHVGASGETAQAGGSAKDPQGHQRLDRRQDPERRWELGVQDEGWVRSTKSDLHLSTTNKAL